ncbi:hypothetical protein ACFFGV_05450 [Pontibacillus salicampi]|uniref:Excalibur calcium-binding domain-containing protein n=1 Tax=Pontibacillus salicampi TaxID=1449801 RepID=A0ABV6LL10_9BACI
MKRLFQFVLAGVLGLGMSLGGFSIASAEHGTDYNCTEDFSTYDEAKQHWDNHGYSKDNDPEDLDRDSDGIPCESLPGGEDAGSDNTSSDESMEGSEDNASSDDSTNADEEGGEMPDTASNYATNALVGLALVVLGGSIFTFRRRFQ